MIDPDKLALLQQQIQSASSANGTPPVLQKFMLPDSGTVPTVSELAKSGPRDRINPSLQHAFESQAAQAASPGLIDDSKLASLGRLRQQLQQQYPSSSAPAAAPADVLQHI